MNHGASAFRKSFGIFMKKLTLVGWAASNKKRLPRKAATGLGGAAAIDQGMGLHKH